MDSTMAEDRPPSIRHWARISSSSSPLGSGSFSIVSLARNLADGSLFAVKSTPCPSPASPSQLLAMHNELRILQGLSSPSILRCFGADFTMAQGSPVSHNLFLEYMEGGSLARLIKRSGGTLEEVCVRHYTRCILQGLDYLHQSGVVHCDIKGQNILLGSSGVKIADFGAAKRLGDDSKSNSEGTLRGTPLWMAPEVVQGIGQGCPSDIWSLGCTVVEMIQGRPPLGHISNTAEALYKVALSEEDLPLPDGITEKARDFLTHCLQRDPKARWTAAELLQHPFVCGIKSRDEGKQEQPSPRSTLEFFSDENESDAGTSSTLSCAVRYKPTFSSSDYQKSRVVEIDIPEQGHWIMVRKADAWSASREIPFMKSLIPGRAHVRKACEVNLDDAEFLRKRRKMG